MKEPFFHTLNDIKTTRIHNEFIFFDSETKEKIISKDEKHLTLKLGWALYWNRKENIKEYFYFEDSGKFWDFVINKCKQDNEIILYAHNTEFDFKVCNGWYELFIKRGFELKSCHIEGKIFILEAYKYGKRILLYDTCNYMPKSLKYLGESLGLNKIEINFNKCTKEELSLYCKNDVEICFKFIETLIYFISKYDLGGLKSTAASLAFNSFRKRFYNKKLTPIFIHIFKSVIRLERNSYKGGICDVVKFGNYKEKLIKLDINSMYPYIMKTKKIPYSYIHSSTNDNIDNLKKYLEKYDIILDCEIFLPKKYAYLLTRFKHKNETKSGFIWGKFHTTLCTPEIEYVLKYGEILEIYEFSVYKRDYIFKDFVNFFYNKRLEFDKQKNTAFSLLCKLFLNSCYGKFGQKGTNTIIYEDESIKPEDYKLYKMPNRVGFKDNILVVGNKIIKKTKNDKNALESSVAISSMITAYARCYLIELLLKVGRENVYYMDTDCLIIKKEAINKIKDYIDFNNEKTLGKLKIEGESNNSTFYRPKFYKFGDEFKCKGVKKIHKITKDDKKTFEVKQEQFERFRTSFRKGSINFVRVINIAKIMDKKYDKGKILKNNEIEAFNANDVIVSPELIEE